MKKYVFLAFLIVFVVAVIPYTMAEDVLFRGLPWGSSPDVFRNSISGGYEYIEEDARLPRWEGIIEDQFIQGVNMMLYTWYPNPLGHIYGIYGLQDTDMKVSGYPISFVYGYFCYGIDAKGSILRNLSDAKLFMASYEFAASDKEVAYSDLKTKLIQLYGNGKEVVDKNESIAFTSEGKKDKVSEITRYFIQGSNGAWVLLEKLVEDGDCNTLLLFYADGETDKMLDELVSAHAVEEQSEGMNNYDGL